MYVTIFIQEKYSENPNILSSDIYTYSGTSAFCRMALCLSDLRLRLEVWLTMQLFGAWSGFILDGFSEQNKVLN